jgi:hypothetical protein
MIIGIANLIQCILINFIGIFFMAWSLFMLLFGVCGGFIGIPFLIGACTLLGGAAKAITAISGVCGVVCLTLLTQNSDKQLMFLPPPALYGLGFV